jgi:hypothetical protein
MSIAVKPNSVADKLWILVLAVGLPVLATWLLGFDTNWDMRNYHLYNPHALLTGRSAIDVAPAQLQSWHNPLLDIPHYLVFTSGLGPRWASAWLVLPSISAIYFLLRLQRALGLATPSQLSQLVLAVLALTGAAHYSTLATTFNDTFVAAAVLGSLWLVLGDQHGPARNQRWLLAGLVAGAIAGLKLSASFYCVALALSALVGGGVKEKLLRLGSLALGGVIGFGVTYAWWGWRLFANFRNPFFPYYNHIFKSPAAQFETFADARFRPGSLLDALLTPIHLLRPSTRFSEFPINDPRLLVGMVAVIALFLLYRKRAQDNPDVRIRIGTLLVFVLSAFVLWVAQYGIYRYAIVLELLGCLLLVLLVQCLPRWRNTVLLIVFVLVSADTKRPNWGHVHAAPPMAGIKPIAIPKDSMIVIASGEPLAYVSLGLPREVPMVAIFNNMMRPDLCTGLNMRARAAITGHAGPIWLLTGPEVSGIEGQPMLTSKFGLVDAGDCMPFESSIGNAKLCRQTRMAVLPPGPDCR